MPGKPDPARGRVTRVWEETFGSPPPPFLSVRFMEKALAYEAQCRAHGGLPAKVQRQLSRIASVGDSARVAPTSTSVQPGSHLVREWNGRTYQVEVLADGYRMDGKGCGRSLLGGDHLKRRILNLIVLRAVLHTG